MLRKYRKTLLLVLLALSTGISRAQSGIPGELEVLVSQGTDKILRQDYEGADSVFRIAVRQFPTHPFGYLYRAAVMQTRSMDFLDPLDFARYDSLLAIAKTLSEKIVDQDPQSAMGYFLLGTAEGYDAYARVDAGSWLSGITKGLGAASDFKKAVELDSSIYDAYVGVGTYYYWKSRKTEFLNWALGDRRSEGIRLLEIASRKGENNRYAALSALTAIYTDRGDYDLAIESARRGLAAYPENRIFQWGLAAAQEQSGKYADAADTYRLLLTNILDAKMANPYNEMLCRLNFVKAMRALKDTAGLTQHLDAILSFEHHSFPENFAKRAEEKFRQARNIKEQLAVQ